MDTNIPSEPQVISNFLPQPIPPSALVCYGNYEPNPDLDSKMLEDSDSTLKDKYFVEKAKESTLIELTPCNMNTNVASEPQLTCNSVPQYNTSSALVCFDKQMVQSSTILTHKLNQDLLDKEMSEDSDNSVRDKDFVPEDQDSSDSSDGANMGILKPEMVNVPKRKGANRETQKRKININSNNTRKKRTERKHRRNTGQEYTTLKGKLKKARELKKLSACRMKCAERFSEDIQEQIFREYWSLGNYDKRVRYVASLVETSNPKTRRVRSENDTIKKNKTRTVTHRFHFKVNGQLNPVCRGCFKQVLGETQMFITLALRNASRSVSGVTCDDKRGHLEPHNKYSPEVIEDIIFHIRSFPSYESHYTRRENSKRYLPAHLTLQKMYDLYCEGRETKVSRKLYEKEFHKLNLAFKKPKVDTCHKCDVIQMKLAVCENEEERKEIEKEKNTHHLDADKAYKQKDSDKELAKADPTTKVFTFDLQQCLPTPFVNSSVSFYKRQLWTYNLTIHDLGTGEVTCYMWHEAEGGRGANQIATCLFLQLIELTPNIQNVVLYSDTCGGQNRNSHVAAMFFYALQQNTNLKLIDHKFMISGHSHMECDVDHSLIEKQKKKLETQINHPYDWYQLVRMTGKKRKFIVKELTYDSFLDFASLYKGPLVLRKKNEAGLPFNWLNCRWFRYSREKEFTLNYKTTLEQSDTFQNVNLARKGRKVKLNPKKCYKDTLPIATEKKKNLLELLPLINPVFRQFYESLKTSADATDVLLGTDEFNEDSD